MKISWLPENFHGKKDMALFLIQNHKFTQWLITLKIRNYITAKNPFLKEYTKILVDFGIDYDEKYQFKPITN